MNENKKVLFIINKHAGTGYKTNLEESIKSYCGSHFVEPTLEFTKERYHAIQLAKEAAISKKFKVVFAVGGDGTLNEVAQGLVDTDQLMGILPRGSGNGLARHLGIPVDFKKSLSMISSENEINMDTFLINNRLSINVSGVGFDGYVANLFGKSGKRGLLEYSRLVLKDFLKFREFEGEIIVDERKFVRSMFVIAFANSSQFGNNARIAPHASVCDGLIDVSIIRKVSITNAVGFVQKMFTGQLEKSSQVEIVKGRRLTLSLKEPIPFHVDGEGIEPTNQFSIEVKPRSLRMVVPSVAKVL